MSASTEDTRTPPSPPPPLGSTMRSRRSAAEPDRITRFASPNRFDSLDAPVSFLDRRPVATSPSNPPSSLSNLQTNGDNVPWRASIRHNVDSITRRAVPERCISQDWLITPRAGQAYQTSHSAMMSPCRISTSQSLPIRRKGKGTKQREQNGVNPGFPRTASTVGTGGIMGDRPDDKLKGQNQRLSELTASVQRLLIEREEERKRMSRREFEIQIGCRPKDDAVEEEISPTRARNVAAQRPILWDKSSEKLQPQKISQELVNDFFSSPLTESPEYGDLVTVSSLKRQQELERARAVAVASAISSANDNEETSANTRQTICSDSCTSKRLMVPTDMNGYVDGAEETPSETDVVEENGDVDTQLDELAGRIGLIERSPSAVERSVIKGVPQIADDIYRHSATNRKSSDTEEEPEGKKKGHRRSTGGNSLLNFFRHISPRISRRGRRSAASTPEVKLRDNRERPRSASATKQYRHSDADSKKNNSFLERLKRWSTRRKTYSGAQSSQGEKDWDSVHSEPAQQRPHSLATVSSCPSPDSVFVPSDVTDVIQPVVNKQVMASLQTDRVRDPYQSFKNRSQQQQRNQQQQNSESASPSTPRPNHLSLTSSVPSSSSAPRSSSGRSITPMRALGSDTLAFKSVSSSVSSSSPGPRYLSVSVSAFGYAYKRPFPEPEEKKETPDTEEKETPDTEEKETPDTEEKETPDTEKADERLSGPASDGEQLAMPVANGNENHLEEKQGAERPSNDPSKPARHCSTAPDCSGSVIVFSIGSCSSSGQNRSPPAPTEMNSLSTRTASEEGRDSPSVLRRRAKPEQQQQQPSARQTVCGSCQDAKRPTSGLNCQWRVKYRRRRNLSETTPRGCYTPSSPLNRSFDSQAANRSSLIMLTVGHSSPRPKSLSVSMGEELTSRDGQGADSAFPAPARTPTSDPVKEVENEEAEIRDGRYFLRIVDTRERDIRVEIAATEADLKDHGLAMTDEVSGILRTAIGKATLLVTDKFAQFRGLCHQNLAAASTNGDHTPETVFATLSSDLEGFWEMVELQVFDIRRMFEEINSLRANSWQRASLDKTDNGDVRPPNPPKKKAPPRRPTSAESSKSAASREEARRRLMAAKREALARRKAEAANMTNNDVVFV